MSSGGQGKRGCLYEAEPASQGRTVFAPAYAEQSEVHSTDRNCLDLVVSGSCSSYLCEDSGLSRSRWVARQGDTKINRTKTNVRMRMKPKISLCLYGLGAGQDR